MSKDKKPAKPQQNLEQQLGERTLDLQRTRADFENYRKRVELDLERARQSGKTAAILKLLPVIDNIERAVGHIPEHLQKDAWAQGVASLIKGLEKSLETMGVARIPADPGTPFNPELHEAIQAEEGDGDVFISKELQAGYLLDGKVVRHSLVNVSTDDKK